MRDTASSEIGVDRFSLGDLFESSFYTIDYYQREYAWGTDEVRTLVEDLLNAFHDWWGASEYRRRPDQAPQYFLGPFVYYRGSGDRRHLVDGQQRFTTLLLIFMGLRNLGREYDLGQQYDEMLTPLIRKRSSGLRTRYRIDIPERSRVLDAIFRDDSYEISPGDSLSVRAIWQRSQDIEPLLHEIQPDSYLRFIDWLLNRVVMAGIRATNSNDAFRIFESMNDRGARLTPVDLLKSHLLSHVGADEDKLNESWRSMLTQLTTERNDYSAPGQFLKSVLQAQYARLDDRTAGDLQSIDNALDIWVRKNLGHLGLREPEDYHSFVKRLLELAPKYRMLLHATRTLSMDLEEVYFNEKNGLSAQLVAMMATLQENDQHFKEKARRISVFIDRWYVLGTLRESPVRQRELWELVVRLLPELRTCVTADDVSRALTRHVRSDGEQPVTLDGFGLRGTNRQQIKYLLARITAYAMQACDLRADVAEYLGNDRPYQVEHLFANKPERHRKEVPDHLQFRTLRNQFGGLALLPASDNAAYGAMPLDQKVIRYGRQNILLGILNKDYHATFGKLRKFARETQTERYVRPFPSNASMAEVTSVRQELYLRLCAQVWSVERLGIDASDIPGYRDPFSAQPDEAPEEAQLAAKPKSDLARLVLAGIVPAGTRLVMDYKGTDFWAEVRPDARVQLDGTGVAYASVNDAGAIVRGTKTCNGMKYWHVLRDEGRVPLVDVRDQARAAGLIPKR
jgi:Protein of unknown function DUF262/Restriction Enzyme Adenine Methylase Associated/Protein of unknown function (DUF1524)